LVALGALLASLLGSAAALADRADFGIAWSGASLSTMQAGGFPDFETRFQLAGDPTKQEGEQDVPWAKLRDLSIQLPPGMVGNLGRFPSCSAATFAGLTTSDDPAAEGCPADSQVGILSPGLTGLLSFPPGVYRSPIYNLERPGGSQHVVARLGAIALFDPLFIDIRLDPKRGYALTGSLVNAPNVGTEITGSRTTLWGVPADSSHDDERFDWSESISCNGPCSPPVASTGDRAAMMTNPSSCGSTGVGMEAISYADAEGGDYDFAPLEVTDCWKVPFAPKLSVRPTTQSAGAASGVEIDVSLPQDTLSNPNALRTADIRQAAVTLPRGMFINTSVADGLGSCLDDQIGLDPDERQLVNVSGHGGPVALAFGGLAVAKLPDLAGAGELQTELEALPNVQDGDIAVSGRRGGPWRVDFGGSLSGRDVPTISGVRSGVQRLAIAAQGGTYELHLDGQATAPLPFDASAATVEASLEGLSSIGAGNVEVTGGSSGSGEVFRIVFGGNLAHTDVSQITTTSALLGPGSFANSYVLAQGGSPVDVRTVEQGGDLRFDGNEPRCPDSSKIASGQVTTPLLPTPLDASVYLTSREDNPLGSMFGAYLVASGEGVTLKIAGRIDVDPESGRVTFTFVHLPQLPIAEIELRFKSGARGIVTTPTECGEYRSDWTMTPWSRTTPEAGTSKFTIDRNCEHEAGPKFHAGSVSGVAGSFTSFVTQVSRDSGTPSFSRISVSAPPGLSANVAGMARCPDAVIAALDVPFGMTAGADTCPSGSRVGTAQVGFGSGMPFYVDNAQVFLAGPYKDAPLSLVVVAPMVSGPFDLGQVAVRISVYLDPETLQARAVSDPLPTMRAGIPLDVRDLRVVLDRAGFATNPTSCSEKQVTGVVERADGDTSPVSDRFQVGSCADLGFEPRVRVRLSGAVGRNGHPGTTVEFAPRAADANISSATVTVPDGELLDTHHIPELCPRELPPKLCPRGSRLGQGRLWSPLLDAPLEGPIYLRRPTNRLPDLLADLRQGRFHVVVHGRTVAGDGHLSVRFPALPDVPISRAVLTLAGGRRGIFVNSESLCGRPPRAMVALTAHNGRRQGLRPRVSLHGRC
jgi:hypothetical protein